jgi:hypothetical protein
MSRYTPLWRLGREEVQLLLVLDLGTRWRWVVSFTPRPRFTSGERTPGTWVGPRAGLDAEARRKILYPCRGSNPGRAARKQTPYTDWATPAPYTEYTQNIKVYLTIKWEKLPEIIRMVSPWPSAYLHGKLFLFLWWNYIRTKVHFRKIRVGPTFFPVQQQFRLWMKSQSKIRNVL